MPVPLLALHTCLQQGTAFAGCFRPSVGVCWSCNCDSGHRKVLSHHTAHLLRLQRCASNDDKCRKHAPRMVVGTATIVRDTKELTTQAGRCQQASHST
jgi:hypothetical protein